MLHPFRGFGPVATLALVSTLVVVPHARAASTSSPAARVYIQIQGPTGSVYGFDASSAGKLSAIPGAPWKPAGQIVGSTQTKFFTLGKTLIHSYGIASDGVLQSQLAQMPIFDYAGGSCGNSSGGEDDAVLDHTGKYIYVTLQVGGGKCAAYQSYIVESDGAFSFDGDTDISWSDGTSDSASLPSILGNESFAYADYDYLDSGPVLTGFRRESSGALALMQFQVTYPALNGDYYTAGSPDASPVGNYVVVELVPAGGGPTQLASYTVDSKGNISTTNTSSNMPASSYIRPSTRFSPSGKLLAAYANGTESNGKSGIELYHFNGAAPLTLYKTLLNGTPIDQVAWDSTNHLYAISKSENKLYVFTVTPTSVTEETSWSIGAPFKMVVVSSSQAAGPSTQFQAPLLSTSGTLAVDGEVDIDTTGSTTVQVNSQAANKTYALQFCPAFNGNNSTVPACFNFAMVTTNSSGNGSSTVKFPKSGNWAGEFSLNDSTGAAVIQSGLYPNVTNEYFTSRLVPESTTNGGAITTQTTQDKLSSGSVSYSDGKVLVTVNGAAANTPFQVGETYERALDSSQSYGIGSFTTNTSGDGSTSISLATAGSDYGDMFQVEGGPGAGFIGGFSIP